MIKLKSKWENYKKNNSNEIIITRDTERLVWELYKSIDEYVRNRNSIIPALKCYQLVMNEYLRIINEYSKSNEQMKDVRDLKIEQLEAELIEKDTIINNYGKFAGLTLKEFYEQQKKEKILFAIERINVLKESLYENDKINIRVCDFEEIDTIFDIQIDKLNENNMFLQN